MPLVIHKEKTCYANGAHTIKLQVFIPKKVQKEQYKDKYK